MTFRKPSLWSRTDTTDSMHSSKKCPRYHELWYGSDIFWPCSAEHGIKDTNSPENPELLKFALAPFLLNQNFLYSMPPDPLYSQQQWVLTKEHLIAYYKMRHQINLLQKTPVWPYLRLLKEPRLNTVCVQIKKKWYHIR